MKTVLAGFAAAAITAAAAATSPATAMPMQSLGVLKAAPAANSYTEVRYRRHWRRHWYPRRHVYVRPYPYYAYAYPYRYRYYRPGPWVQFGPFGFGVW
jgi:hypothetical protein